MMEFADLMNYVTTHPGEVKLGIAIGISCIPLYSIYDDYKFWKKFDTYIEEVRSLPEEELRKPGTCDRLLKKHRFI